MKNKLTTSIAIAALILAGAATCANAQDKQTLDLLVSKGIITKEEASNVLKKSSEIQITAKEKSVKSIKLIGRVQTQYEYIAVDEYANGASTSLDTKSDFLMRRMFLGMEASLGSGWSATVIADFGRSSDNYLEYAYISKKLDWEFLKGKADMGYRKVNFALEEYTSASKLLTVERSIATRYFSEPNNGRRLGFAGRHTGLYWNGKVEDIDGLEYGVSVTNSYQNSPASFPDNADTQLLYAANIAYAAKISDAKLQVGFNFAYTNGVNVAGTAGKVHSTILGINPYLKFNLYGLELWSDFLLANIDDGKSGPSGAYTRDATPMGFNIAAEYKFDIGEMGKIAPAFRYSWIDTDGRGIKMSDGIRNSNASTTYDAGQSIYVGLNWYIIGNDLKFQVGYEWAQLNGNPNGGIAGHSDANAVRAQMQVLF